MTSQIWIPHVLIIVFFVICIWLYAFKNTKTLFWERMHKLHQISKWTLDTVVTLYCVHWARTNSISECPLPCMTPVSVTHGDELGRFAGTGEAAAVLVLQSRAGQSHLVPVDFVQCTLPSHPPSASPGPHLCLVLWWRWAPVSPVCHLSHQGWKQRKVRTMTSNPFPLVSANICELQLTLSHVCSSSLPSCLLCGFKL